jgi:hypothetical protein
LAGEVAQMVECLLATMRPWVMPRKVTKWKDKSFLSLVSSLKLIISYSFHTCVFHGVLLFLLCFPVNFSLSLWTYVKSWNRDILELRLWTFFFAFLSSVLKDQVCWKIFLYIRTEINLCEMWYCTHTVKIFLSFFEW